MTDHRPPPPEPEDCLIHSRTSRYKGGTLIAEDVQDYETHRKRIASPDAYRPERCRRCDGDVLHVHDYPQRQPRGEPGLPPVITIVRHICADPSCRATWRILPAFLARHLWRVWPTVEGTMRTRSPPPPVPAQVPRRTARRWRERLASRAKQLVLLLATSGGVLLETIAKCAGLDATRLTLVEVHAQVTATPLERQLAELAALVHRLERGLRLM
jgi:hypothetical protein